MLSPDTKWTIIEFKSPELAVSVEELQIDTEKIREFKESYSDKPHVRVDSGLLCII